MVGSVSKGYCVRLAGNRRGIGEGVRRGAQAIGERLSRHRRGGGLDSFPGSPSFVRY